MKKIISLALISIFATFNVRATDKNLEIKHTEVIFANQGYCSYLFNLNAFNGDEFSPLEISVIALDKTGKKIDSGIMQTESFGGSRVDQNISSYLELICNDDIANFEIIRVSEKSKDGSKRNIPLKNIQAENPKLATVKIKK